MNEKKIKEQLLIARSRRDALAKDVQRAARYLAGIKRALSTLDVLEEALMAKLLGTRARLARPQIGAGEMYELDGTPVVPPLDNHLDADLLQLVREHDADKLRLGYSS